MDKLFAKIPFVDNVLKGVGQIMLQENRWTGLLFLVGLFLGSWQCGVAAILATTAGTFTAMKLNYDKSQINAGLYGFSAALVGVALAFIFQTTILIWVLIILGGTLAAIIQHFFIQKKIPVFTFPFIIITWALVFLLHQFTHIQPSDLITAEAVHTDYDDFLTCTNGFGEVIFQGGGTFRYYFLCSCIYQFTCCCLIRTYSFYFGCRIVTAERRAYSGSAHGFIWF